MDKPRSLSALGASQLSNLNHIPPASCMPEPRALPPPAPSLRHHPQQWQAGTLDVAGLSAAAQVLAQQPGFDLALRHFAVCWQQGCDSSPVLNSVMRNNARYVLLLACIEQGWMVSGTGHHYTLQPTSSRS